MGWQLLKTNNIERTRTPLKEFAELWRLINVADALSELWACVHVFWEVPCLGRVFFETIKLQTSSNAAKWSHKKSSFNLNLNGYRLSRGGGKKQFFWWFRREKVNQTTEEIGLVLRATGKVLQEKMKHFSCDADKEKWFTAFHHYLLRAFPLWFGALEPLSDGADRQFFSLSKDTKCFTV